MEKSYKIKPLKWQGEVNESQSMEARTPFGSYRIYEKSNVREWETKYSWSFCFDEYYDEGDFECNTVAEGKKSANKHWTERIEQALVKI